MITAKLQRLGKRYRDLQHPDKNHKPTDAGDVNNPFGLWNKLNPTSRGLSGWDKLRAAAQQLKTYSQSQGVSLL